MKLALSILSGKRTVIEHESQLSRCIRDNLVTVATAGVVYAIPWEALADRVPTNAKRASPPT
jgi:hypothetical protein